MRVTREGAPQVGDRALSNAQLCFDGYSRSPDGLLEGTEVARGGIHTLIP